MDCGEWELEVEAGEREGRLADMAPEVVCMLLAWMGAEETLEVRTTCWTMKRAADEVVPWMERRECWMSGTAYKMCRLAATDTDVLRRTILHAPAHMYTYGVTVMEVAVWTGNADAVKILVENGCRYCEWVCREAMELGHVQLLERTHVGSRKQWPCADWPCTWAKEHKANEL